MLRFTTASMLALFASLSLVACGGADAGSGGGETPTQEPTTAGATTGDDPTTTGATTSEEPRTVSVAVAPIAHYAPLHLGVEKGFFEEEGLTIDFASGRIGTETVTAVISGTIEFAAVALPPLLVAEAEGLDVSLVAPSTVTPGESDESSVALLTDAGSEIQSVEDLEGATIAVNALQAQLELMVRLAVEQGGGDPEGLEFVEVPFPEMPAALQRGDVDAIAAVEPFVSAAVGDGAVSVAEIDRALPAEAPVTAFFTSRSLAESDPELVTRFRNAMIKSQEYAAEHLDEVRAIIPEFSEVPSDVAQQMALPTYSSSVSREGVVATVDAMNQFGFLSGEPDVDSMLQSSS